MTTKAAMFFESPKPFENVQLDLDGYQDPRDGKNIRGVITRDN
ncbi:hypothetical protein [Mycobacterium lentiflavum]|uniref:Uncharacterized protein n=1 Tax=Mycobacterium lentiflavum TaxID=141349 RepID=A0ABY5T6D7_MYCLN|nr:hypothetical protein [Mycobacterium lentiflavum]UVI52118.1 hypothetical protein MJO58_28720 [Mycobacterium lentiflavum]